MLVPRRLLAPTLPISFREAKSLLIGRGRPETNHGRPDKPREITVMPPLLGPGCLQTHHGSPDRPREITVMSPSLAPGGLRQTMVAQTGPGS